MQAFQALQDKVPPVDLSASLNAWKKGYTEGALDLEGMHKAIGEFAFGLQKYKEAVDKVLMKDQYKSDAKVRDIQRHYQNIFGSRGKPMTRAKTGSATR
jgi:hypothetical protein